MYLWGIVIVLKTDTSTAKSCRKLTNYAKHESHLEGLNITPEMNALMQRYNIES